MAADREHSPESVDTERTLADSPDDTTPPEDDATLIDRSFRDPEATLSDPSYTCPPATHTTPMAESFSDPDATFADGPHARPPEEDATLLTESIRDAGRTRDPESTLADPSYTCPPETHQTRITEPVRHSDSTLVEDAGSSPQEGGETIIESEASSAVVPDDDQTMVTTDAPEADENQTVMMDPSRVEPTDETAATMVTPSVEDTSEDATTFTPSASEPDQTQAADLSGKPAIDATNDATVLGYSDAGDAEPSDQTVLHNSRVNTASGTATEYIPAEEERQSEYPSLGRFEIQKLLGQGAFGAVYLAHDPHLDRKVAIKVAKTGVLVGKQDVDRFMREARSAAQLRHPNIVPVYEVGQLPNTNFIAYEYVEGRTLGDLMKEKKTLPVEEAAVYMKKIASGLHYAHEHGIIHRDMKPDNVLLDVNDEPHIADFGLARRDEGDTTRTREGMFMGTPSYMSPEQASGKAHLADARSDVWSLGVMLQEMLTGVRPFRGNVTEVLVAVQNYEPPSIRTINKNIPEDLETIVEKCLTKNLDERFQSAEMLADELDRFLRGEPIVSRPISVWGRTWRWAKRRPDIASLLGVIVVGALVFALVAAGLAYSATSARNLAHQQAIQRAEAQLTSVQTADAASLPVLMDSLMPYREELRPQLMGLVGDDSLSDAEQSRVRLAATSLYVDAPQHDDLVRRSADDLLRVEPAELVVRTSLLKPFRERVEAPLWKAAQDGVLPQRTRFQALAALASLGSLLPDWPDMAADMVAEMLTMNPLEMSNWLPAVQPIRGDLESALVESFTQGTDPNVQYRAAIVLGDLFRDTPETLIALVPRAQANQLPPLLEALKPRAEFFAERLTDQLLRKIVTSGDEPLSDAQSSSAVNLALALLGLGRGEPVWPLLKPSPNEHLRTSLIHTIVPAGISWEEVATRMEWEQDAGIIAALCLTLGEYGEGELLPSDRDRLAPGLLELFKTHPHPGVHSAVEWTLRQWGRDGEVNVAMAQLESRVRNPELNWHVDGQGNTFAIIEPDTFLMGSPEDEPERNSEEVQHRRLIPRTYGIATREVTVAEYMEFDPEFKIKNARQYAPEDSCPIIYVTWYDAIAYCRWLSEREGFKQHEMCYPSLDELSVLRKSFGAKSLELPEDLLDRPAYRLPTAAEWEYAARGGAVTSRPFGSSGAWAAEYAWYLENCDGHTWPTGLLKPNDYGLFDIQGNAHEWCHNYFFETPPDPGADGVVVDGVDSRDGFNREARGGGTKNPIGSLRVAYSDFVQPNLVDRDIGFRLARTYRVAPAAQQANAE